MNCCYSCEECGGLLETEHSEVDFNFIAVVLSCEACDKLYKLTVNVTLADRQALAEINP